MTLRQSSPLLPSDPNDDRPTETNQNRPAGNEGASSQVCAQGKSLSKFIVASAGWELVAFDKGGKFPTFGYETTAAGEPLILEVDTTGTGDAKRGRGVAVTYTKAQSGFGKFKIS